MEAENFMQKKMLMQKQLLAFWEYDGQALNSLWNKESFPCANIFVENLLCQAKFQ